MTRAVVRVTACKRFQAGPPVQGPRPIWIHALRVSVRVPACEGVLPGRAPRESGRQRGPPIRTRSASCRRSERFAIAQTTYRGKLRLPRHGQAASSTDVLISGSDTTDPLPLWRASAANFRPDFATWAASTRAATATGSDGLNSATS